MAKEWTKIRFGDDTTIEQFALHTFKVLFPRFFFLERLLTAYFHIKISHHIFAQWQLVAEKLK